MIASLLLILAQGPAADAPAWDKIRAHLQERIRGENLADRLRALGEAAATQNQRAFELLAESLKWAQNRKAQIQEDLDPAKKELNRLRDEHSRQSKEREKLLSKKKLSSSEMERVQSLNQSITSLDKSIQEQKAEVEKQNGEVANIQQMESSVQEGCASLLREASPGLFDAYRKAFAKAVDFPGSLSQGVLYVEVLVASGRKEAVPHLEKILREAKGSETLFLAAAKGMTALGGPDVVPTLVSLLAFPNGSVRKAAHEALKSSTGQSLPPDKAAWEKWLQEKKG